MTLQKIIPTFLLSVSFAAALGQNCKDAHYLKPGAKLEMTVSDANGALKAKEVYTYSDIQNAGSGYAATMQKTKYDKSGKQIETGKADIICGDGGMKISFQLPPMDDSKSAPEPVFFSYPANMKPGQELEANLKFAFDGRSNGKKMNVSMEVANRRVIGNEKVSTPAGSWTAVKIGYDMNIRFKVVGIGIPMKLRITEWYVPGIGVVRSDTYRGDKLEETSVATAL